MSNIVNKKGSISILPYGDLTLGGENASGVNIESGKNIGIFANEEISLNVRTTHINMSNDGIDLKSNTTKINTDEGNVKLGDQSANKDKANVIVNDLKVNSLAKVDGKTAQLSDYITTTQPSSGRSGDTNPNVDIKAPTGAQGCTAITLSGSLQNSKVQVSKDTMIVRLTLYYNRKELETVWASNLQNKTMSSTPLTLHYVECGLKPNHLYQYKGELTWKSETYIPLLNYLSYIALPY